GSVVLARAVVLGAEDLERRVEMDVHLAAVGSSDLDLVGALLVAGLAARHTAAADVVEGDRAGPLEGRARDGPPGGVVVAGRDGVRGPGAQHDRRQRRD